MCLDGVRVRGLSQDFKEGGVRHKEEPWENESLLLQVASERLLAEFQLFQEVWQQLAQGLVSYTTLDHIGGFMGLGHNLHPGLVNAREPLGFLRGKKQFTFVLLHVCHLT